MAARSEAISYDNVGDALQAQGDLAGALKSYRDGLAIAERAGAVRHRAIPNGSAI